MSQGERIARVQEQANRFLSTRQTKTSWEQTLIVQGKASKVVFPGSQTPETLSIATTRVVGPTDRAIPANVAGPYATLDAKCTTFVASGSQTFNERDALTQRRQGQVYCAQPSYTQQNAYAIDLQPLGGVCCPSSTYLPNTAKTTWAENATACKRFYFPSPAQPPLCCPSPLPGSALYPKPPISWELRRYGAAGIPQVAPRVEVGEEAGGYPAPSFNRNSIAYNTTRRSGDPYYTYNVYDNMVGPVALTNSPYPADGFDITAVGGVEGLNAGGFCFRHYTFGQPNISKLTLVDARGVIVGAATISGISFVIAGSPNFRYFILYRDSNGSALYYCYNFKTGVETMGTIDTNPLVNNIYIDYVGYDLITMRVVHSDGGRYLYYVQGNSDTPVLYGGVLDSSSHLAINYTMRYIVYTIPDYGVLYKIVQFSDGDLNSPNIIDFYSYNIPKNQVYGFCTWGENVAYAGFYSGSGSNKFLRIDLSSPSVSQLNVTGIIGGNTYTDIEIFNSADKGYWQEYGVGQYAVEYLNQISDQYSIVRFYLYPGTGPTYYYYYYNPANEIGSVNYIPRNWVDQHGVEIAATGIFTLLYLNADDQFWRINILTLNNSSSGSQILELNSAQANSDWELSYDFEDGNSAYLDTGKHTFVSFYNVPYDIYSLLVIKNDATYNDFSAYTTSGIQQYTYDIEVEGTGGCLYIITNDGYAYVYNPPDSGLYYISPPLYLPSQGSINGFFQNTYPIGPFVSFTYETTTPGHYGLAIYNAGSLGPNDPILFVPEFQQINIPFAYVNYGFNTPAADASGAYIHIVNTATLFIYYVDTTEQHLEFYNYDYTEQLFSITFADTSVSYRRVRYVLDQTYSTSTLQKFVWTDEYSTESTATFLPLVALNAL
jgi:hypothetical protein